MRNHRKVEMSEFCCTKCGKKNPMAIPRVVGRLRKGGHLKKLYCFNCKEETNHCEIKGKYTAEKFMQDWENGEYQGKETEYVYQY